ncbi:hypothetical protein LTR09_008757 [Extremus antarcticus]|uniref:Uncharacterized protein n=1 Tax=Extremus antarcticus TaxID=702011 RepID=A0AAJ0DAL0_9PEZI|nr:hypothetical protein LTR09_008757 [Extremus antarcticus]
MTSSALTRPTTILRFTILLFSIVTIILLGLAYRLTGPAADWEFYGDGPGRAFPAMCFAAVAWSIIWSATAVGMTLGHVDYHPGVEIGLDFLGLGFNWGFAGALISWCVYMNHTASICDEDHGRYQQKYDKLCRQGKTLDGLEYSSGAFLLLIGCCHLIIFIEACRAAHNRRIQSKQDLSIELGQKSSNAGSGR